MNLKHSDITALILEAYYKVYNKLGHGFLESIYENAMLIELKKLGLFTERQKKINVFYEGEIIGAYNSDILVNEKVTVELKATTSLHPKHITQVLNYLKATDLEVGLLLNFGEKPKFKRLIFENKK